jgi:ribosomal protein S14
MLHSKIKDLKFRKFFYKVETKRIVNNFVFKNLMSKSHFYKNLKPELYNENLKKTQVFKFYNKKTIRVKNRIVRRCVVTNRGRGTLRAFKISRPLLRELMGFGVIPGYKKSVW